MIDGPLPAPKGQLIIPRSADWKRTRGAGKSREVYYQPKESFAIKISPVLEGNSIVRGDKENERTFFRNGEPSEDEEKIADRIVTHLYV